MSDSLQPHGLQPTRLLHPWDFPGKSTGVGCHFLLQCMKVKSESEVTQSRLTLCNCSPPGSSVHGIFQARVLEWGAMLESAIGSKWAYMCMGEGRPWHIRNLKNLIWTYYFALMTQMTTNARVTT